MTSSSLRSLFLLVVVLATTTTLQFTRAASDSKNPDYHCKEWAEMGECQSNPRFMRASCSKSCERWDAKMGLENNNEIAHIRSIYELNAKDIDGQKFHFTNLLGKVAIIVNVASYCGYTEDHYRGLVELYDSLKDTKRFEILAFPSNQFGEQEPDTCDQIKKFAVMEKGVEFRMMYKVDVNGQKTDQVYKYLKKMAGPPQIAWNFSTYYIVSPTGEIRAYSGVEPMDLQELVFDMLRKDL